MTRKDIQAITLNGDKITEDEIAAVHVDPITHGYWVILSHYSYIHNGHQAEEYHINPGDPEYPQMDDLYKKMYGVLADEEYDDVVYFRSRHYESLEDLYNYLERNHYAFTFQLGPIGDNYIRVYRNQQNLVPAMQQAWMDRLIQRYK